MSESKKFCPLGFFSFYVNKSEAQAGACHHCVEDNCALWNEDYEECSLKVGLDSLTSLAESFGSGQTKMPLPKRHIEVEGPKLSIFDKLRRKTEGQKLPTAGENTISTTIFTPPIPPPPPLAAPITPVFVSTPQSSSDELLKPPDVPSEILPIISITSKEN